MYRIVFHHGLFCRLPPEAADHELIGCVEFYLIMSNIYINVTYNHNIDIIILHIILIQYYNNMIKI